MFKKQLEAYRKRDYEALGRFPYIMLRSTRMLCIIVYKKRSMVSINV